MGDLRRAALTMSIESCSRQRVRADPHRRQGSGSRWRRRRVRAAPTPDSNLPSARRARIPQGNRMAGRRCRLGGTWKRLSGKASNRAGCFTCDPAQVPRFRTLLCVGFGSKSVAWAAWRLFERDGSSVGRKHPFPCGDDPDRSGGGQEGNTRLYRQNELARARVHGSGILMGSNLAGQCVGIMGN